MIGGKKVLKSIENIFPNFSPLVDQYASEGQTNQINLK